MSAIQNTDPERIPGYSELRILAERLKQDTLGKVEVSLDHSVFENLTRSSLKIKSAGTGQGFYELVQIRALDIQYPVVLEVAHFGEAQRISKLPDPHALQNALDSVLQDAGTKRIIQLYADEAIAPIKSSETRPFLVAQKPFDHNGALMTHVAFLGIGGFLSLETMQRLAKDPDSEGAAVQSHGENYVATFSFEGSVKVTLSREELERLQSSARSIVDGSAGQ